MQESVKSATKRYAHIHALDRIAIPLIPTVGVEMAYRRAIVEGSRDGASAGLRSNRDRKQTHPAELPLFVGIES